MGFLSGKQVLLGVTGGIAAYKSAELVRRLREQGATVRVVMTQGAQAFITPLTLQALSGQPPFKTDNLHALMRMVLTQRPEPPQSVKPALPRDCGDIAMKCLEKDPERRYATAEALAEDLRRVQDGLPTLARPLTTPARIWAAEYTSLR